MHLIKTDFGGKLGSFSLDYLGGHPGMDIVILNATVVLYEKGMHILTTLSRDNAFLEWRQIRRIRFSGGRDWFCEVEHDDGLIRLQNTDRSISPENFLNIIRQIRPDLPVEWAKADPSNVFDLAAKRREKESREQEQRVRAFLAALESDDDDEILSVWKERFESELVLPFAVEILSEGDSSTGDSATGPAAKVIGWDGIDELYGIMAVVRRGRKKYVLPLSELEPVDKDGDHYQLIEDYIYWLGGR
ncbi:calcium binding protein [Hydrogenispora ethanolica]|uniref:Calcium binding protein n=1 Tax=Hydrogenispora ethanolica TaxID=1082276 RepID=A0A4R1R9M8_HYDET|nr:calcium-binding protein [Hydrogenispora ethanolica]TCL62388.1 calcium binding protein [Hydrogenispora ethanolica]